MRKFFAVLLPLVMLFLIGCSGEASKPKKPGVNSSTPQSSNVENANPNDDISDSQESETESKFESVEYSYAANGNLNGSFNVTKSRADINDVSHNDSYIDFMKGKGGAEEEAYNLRQKILSMKDTITSTGTKYYFSPGGSDENDGLSPETPFRTFNALSMLELKYGDAILLERDSVFRTDTVLRLTSGVSLGAYGEGDKPKIYGSVQNYAGKNLWKPSQYKNIWMLEYTRADAGVLVINHGEQVGKKVYYVQQLVKNNDFAHVNGVLYLYSDKNPNNYESIEIGSRMHLIFIPIGSQDITISNICLKFTGSHGISSGGQVKNVTITGCEIGWIGGSVQGVSDNVTLFGNGIEFWNSSENITVKNNWIYQIYDAGLTFQGSGPFKNIKFVENLIEYTTMSIEYWSTTHDRDITGILIDKNIIRFSGYGWGAAGRRANGRTAHINVGHTPTDYRNLEVTISNNIFDCSYQAIFRVPWLNYKPENQRYTITSNTYYQRSRNGENDLGLGGEKDIAFNFGVSGTPTCPSTATNQKEFEVAVKAVDSNPKHVKWITK